jgi:hypothetical protein
VRDTDQPTTPTARLKRELLVALVAGGALVVVGCLLPFSKLAIPGPFKFEASNNYVTGYETDSGKVLLGMGVVLMACAFALWLERPAIMRLATALAAAIALGAVMVAVDAGTGPSPPPIEGFQGFAANRSAVGYYVALVGAFLALASTAVVALDVLRER